MHRPLRAAFHVLPERISLRVVSLSAIGNLKGQVVGAPLPRQGELDPTARCLER
jgi:hypothetical protein